jgi:hypothetical protein
LGSLTLGFTRHLAVSPLKNQPQIERCIFLLFFNNKAKPGSKIITHAETLYYNQLSLYKVITKDTGLGFDQVNLDKAMVS